ncbi:MAG: ferritin-like domain-containing protein [Chloroflexota bacterium]
MSTKTKKLEKVDTGLTAENRGKLVQCLNTLLADEHLLYTKSRNYHWNVTGIHFTTLHELFEQHYNEIQTMADEIAERARKLGGTPIGTMLSFWKPLALRKSRHHPLRTGYDCQFAG